MCTHCRVVMGAKRLCSSAPWGSLLLRMTESQLDAGATIADRYRLLARLGAGGMGSVWRAEHIQLRSPVAIKLLNEAIISDGDMVERFMREAQSAAALRSNHVVTIFDYGVEDGTPYIAMELLTGRSLAEHIQRSGRLSFGYLSWVFDHVAKAMTKAHAEGITHRDLKPDNVFIIDDGDERCAKVLDFGIAKVTGAHFNSDISNNTATGTMLGTPYYMSPEQAQGTRSVDWRSDLWSMAIIAFECVVGRVPFESTALGDLVLQICTKEAPVPSTLVTVPEGFDAWFAKAVSKDPDDRFQSAREMNDALQRVLSGVPEGLTATLVSSSGRPARTAAGEAVTLARPQADAPIGSRPAPSSQPIPMGSTARSVFVDVDVVPKRRSRWVVLTALGLVVLALGVVLARLSGRHTADATDLRTTASVRDEEPPRTPSPELTATASTAALLPEPAPHADEPGDVETEVPSPNSKTEPSTESDSAPDPDAKTDDATGVPKSPERPPLVTQVPSSRTPVRQPATPPKARAAFPVAPPATPQPSNSGSENTPETRTSPDPDSLFSDRK